VGDYIRLGVGAGPAGRGHWPRGRGREAPCRPFGRAVSWARPAAHALHGAPGRAGTGTRPAVPCRPLAVPWAVSPAHGPHGHIYQRPAENPKKPYPWESRAIARPVRLGGV